MAELQHFSHECPLTSPKIVAKGICSICYKDDRVELACIPCDFSLCKACSQLPQMVWHDFHPDHPLEFCLHQYDQKPGHVVCSGCGNMSSGSFYKCKECEICLDMGCALSASIFRGWDDKELLHYSHCHLLKRCRPGTDARGSCIICELPLSPSAICYGCVHCYSFVHERCIDFPREIAHPVHPAHPLKRLAYTRICYCDICGENIDGVPFGCQECDFDAHLRCLDSFLRGLMHKSHQHRLIYRTKSYISFTSNHKCQICRRINVISLDSYFYCVQCSMVFHFECLEIPEFVVDKSHHIHPLVCKLLPNDDDFLEYCGVCETMVYAGHHVYSCEECGFLGHIECILRKEPPSPLYLKDLYACSKDNTSSTNQDDHDTNDELETKLMVNSMNGHIHVMRSVDFSELDESANCYICTTKILGSPSKCETCIFQAHIFCAELGRPLQHRVHKHPLTLLPMPASGAGVTMNCGICTKDIKWFNLFCRLCNFAIHTNCIFKGKHLFRKSQRGQKIIGSWEGSSKCIQEKHQLHQITVSKSYSITCAICEDKVCGKDKTIHMSSLDLSPFVQRVIRQSSLATCLVCEDVYHPLCLEVEMQIKFYHPFHPQHNLEISFVSGSKCRRCKLEIEKYGYQCLTCKISFHIKCLKAVRSPKEIKPHSHYFYHFWIADSSITRTCRVCAKPCGVSFYGCISCDFNAHAECIGFPSNVKNQKHQHTLVEINDGHRPPDCFLCGDSIGGRKLHGRRCTDVFYSCKLCNHVFHLKCIMSTDDREAATEEDQYGDIYLMYLERHLLEVLENDVEDIDSS